MTVESGEGKDKNMQGITKQSRVTHVGRWVRKKLFRVTLRFLV